MKVLVIKKGSFSVEELNYVTKIEISGSNFVITAGTTHTYATADYVVRIIGG